MDNLFPLLLLACVVQAIATSLAPNTCFPQTNANICRWLSRSALQVYKALHRVYFLVCLIRCYGRRQKAEGSMSIQRKRFILYTRSAISNTYKTKSQPWRMQNQFSWGKDLEFSMHGLITSRTHLNFTISVGMSLSTVQDYKYRVFRRIFIVGILI